MQQQTVEDEEVAFIPCHDVLFLYDGIGSIR